MKQNQALSLFDQTTKDNIVEFGKRLSKTSADVYLLMARKAACFIDCLLEANIVKLSGFVTSERILNMRKRGRWF